MHKNFGAENPEPFVPVLNTTVKLIALGAKEEKNVLGSALLCVAEVVSTLEALAIPQLPRYAEGTWGIRHLTLRWQYDSYLSYTLPCGASSLYC